MDFSFRRADKKALRERLLWISEHRNEAIEMGRMGRQKMETDFNADIHYERIMNVYQKFL